MDAALPPLQRLRRFTADDLPCKICGGPARPFGGADFNRNCEEVNGKYLPSAGVLIVYRRCADCGFLFTDAFDEWSPADWAREVYNEGYAEVDPDYDARRPDANVEFIAKHFGRHGATLRVLDYGGGSGRLAEGLRQAGFQSVVTYDPFNPAHSTRPEGRFNLVTCFEAIEHMPDPHAGAADIASFLDGDSLLLFSTVVQPDVFDVVGMRWWYIGPRNGHISLHSGESLKRLWGRQGLQVVKVQKATHAAFRKPPSFIRIKGVS